MLIAPPSLLRNCPATSVALVISNRKLTLVSISSSFHLFNHFRTILNHPKSRLLQPPCIFAACLGSWFALRLVVWWSPDSLKSLQPSNRGSRSSLTSARASSLYSRAASFLGFLTLHRRPMMRGLTNGAML